MTLRSCSLLYHIKHKDIGEKINLSLRYFYQLIFFSTPLINSMNLKSLWNTNLKSKLFLKCHFQKVHLAAKPEPFTGLN